MSGLRNFGFDRSGPSPAAVIKPWVSAAFGLGDEVTVMVTELRCSEPGCPPLETVIALLAAGSPTRSYTIPRPLAEVTEADVRALADRPPD